MKEKSNDSLCAAQSLINNKFGTASIHCSYYAVLQYMKYVLAEKSETPIPYSEQNDAARKDGVNGSHNYLLTEVANKITDYSKITDYRKVKKFKESFRDLKDARVKADYSITSFSVEEGIEYKEKACRLINNLNTFFTEK